MKLLIDGNHMASRARFAANTPMTTYDGRQSGTAYVFLRSLSWILQHTGCSYWHTTVVWDGGRSPYRKKLYPDYKKRKPFPAETAEQDKIDQEAYYWQIKTLHEQFLPNLGIQSIKVPKCEADDIISVLAHHNAEFTTHHVYIHSGDKDFDQLVSDKIYRLDSRGNVVTLDKVQERWGVTGRAVVRPRSMEGDESDNIDGVPGIGEKRAQKLAPYAEEILRDDFSVDTASFEMPKGCGKYAQVLHEHQEIMHRNELLMLLPTNLTDPVIDIGQFSEVEQQEILESMKARPKRRIDQFFAVCRSWDFNVGNEVLYAL